MPAQPALKRSNAEAFPAPAFALGFRVLELEGLVEPLFDEVDHRPVDQRQTGGIYHDFDTVGLEDLIARMNLVGVVHHIGKARAARLLDAETKTHTRAALRQGRPAP